MPMSDDHKAALAQGRKESRSIKSYLNALGSRKPGRPVTPDSLNKRVASIESRLEGEGDALKRVDLHQERLDAQAALKGAGTKVDMPELEKGFIESARAYSERRGISYSAWRQAGVPASILTKAGIARTRRT